MILTLKQQKIEEPFPMPTENSRRHRILLIKRHSRKKLLHFNSRALDS